MRVGILGTFVWDTIHHPRLTNPVEQWGGLAYGLAAASGALPQGWRIVPIARVGADLADEARAFLATLSGIDAGTGIRFVPEPNNRVELRYAGDAERTERLTGGVHGWAWEDLAPVVVGLDALYVNFISGFELALPAVARLRAEGPPFLYADLHSLFLGPPGAGARVPRRLPDRDRWLAGFDAVQLNEAELTLLTPPGRDPLSFLREVPRHGPSLAAVTLGSRGAMLVRRVEEPSPAADPDAGAAELVEAEPGRVEQPSSTAEPAGGSAADPRAVTAARGAGGPEPGGAVEVLSIAPPGGVVRGDPTGCGDVWGSVFCLGLLEGRGAGEAAARACTAAGAKIGCARIGDLAAAVRRALAPG